MAMYVLIAATAQMSGFVGLPQKMMVILFPLLWWKLEMFN